jgi:Fe-S cluster biogenesis protein NfuA
MTTSTDSVSEAVAAMDAVVAKDGGHLTLIEHDVDKGTVRVQFDEGKNDDCPGCLITADMLGAFLGEAIRARGVVVEELVVDSTKQASTS